MSSAAGEVAARGSVAILGCGWLGSALAADLLAAGYRVLGSTTTPGKLDALAALGIEPYLISLPAAAPFGLEQRDEQARQHFHPKDSDAAPVADATAAASFWQADQLVIAFPPGRAAGSDNNYPGAVLAAVLAYRRAQSSGRIIMCSSTGIYGAAMGVVDVQTPIRDASARVQALVLAEAQVKVQSQRPHCILRLGGLYGGQRHPGRHLAGRQDVPAGDAPVNVASQQRVVERLRHYLDAPFWMSVLENVVDAEHPTRRDFYTAFAKTHHLPLPSFLPGGADDKVVV